MRIFRVITFCKVAVFMAILGTFNSSCKDDDPISPSYVGTWVSKESVPTGFGTFWVKNTMTMTETTFTSLSQIQISPTQWLNYFSRKGSMTVTGSSMKVTLAEVGLSSYYIETGFPTGTITMYKSGSEEFELIMGNSDKSLIIKSEYSVSGNLLTHKTDDNGDYDYLDEGETTVYTRQ